MFLGKTLRRWMAGLLADDQDRLIFSFWDGRRWRRIDPIVALRAFDAHERFNFDRHPAAVDDGDEEAIEITVGAVRDVFGVKPLGEREGLTETETIRLFMDFMDFCGDLKKKVSRGPTSPPSTGPECSDASDTSCKLDCGSTLVGSEPGSLPA